MATAKAKQKEAVMRMKALGVMPDIIQKFQDEGAVYVYEDSSGNSHFATSWDFYSIREFEKKSNALVYMVVRSYTGFGLMDCMLHVSDWREEWKHDRRGEESFRPCVWCVNYDLDITEMGEIVIQQTDDGNFIRTA